MKQNGVKAVNNVMSRQDTKVSCHSRDSRTPFRHGHWPEASSGGNHCPCRTRVRLVDIWQNFLHYFYNLEQEFNVSEKFPYQKCDTLYWFGSTVLKLYHAGWYDSISYSLSFLVMTGYQIDVIRYLSCWPRRSFSSIRKLIWHDSRSHFRAR